MWFELPTSYKLKPHSTPPNSFNPAGCDVVAWWIPGESVGKMIVLFKDWFAGKKPYRGDCY